VNIVLSLLLIGERVAIRSKKSFFEVFERL
jgi:hypothetical protein